MQVLLVIDLQNGVCHPAVGKNVFHYAEVLHNVNNRIAEYRKNKQPIIFIQHMDDELKHNSFEWQFVPELAVDDNDVIVEKTQPDAFYQTNLTQVLEQLNCDVLEIAGAQTEYCIDTTIKVAFDRGYRLCMSNQLVTTTVDNAYMSASQTIDFYKHIWNQCFLTFV